MNWNNQIHCATGSEVPCLSYNVKYAHEKIPGENYQYADHAGIYTSDTDFPGISFNAL